MSFLNPFGVFTGGIDLDEEQKRAEDLKAKELALVDKRESDGYYSNDGAYSAARKKAQDAPLFGYQSDDHKRNRAVNDARDEVLAAAADGAAEGLKSTLNFAAGSVSGALNGVGSFAWKAIPWWLWLSGALYISYTFGVFNKLKRFIPK
jgi:hypothetical protein